MRRIILTLITFAVFSVTIFAQSFSISPSPVHVTGDASAFRIEAPSIVTNNTNEVLNLRWERIEEELPAEWVTAICDNVICWLPSKSIGDYILAPNEEARMKPEFRINSTPGMGTIRMLIYDPLDSLNTVQENVYTADVQMAVSVDEPDEIDFMIYPNPATNFVVLPKDDRIAQAVLYNITGQEVKTFNMAANTNRFDIMNVVRGTYLLQFIDEVGTILHTTRLTKK